MTHGKPKVIILGGPNGCGKTTSSPPLLVDALGVKTFVNADVLARGLAGFDPESAAVEAARILLERLRRLAEERVSFAFETTLAGRAYVPWLRRWKAEGYAVAVYYFWVRDPDLAVGRVAQRVRNGGHDIPEATIRQRFGRSMRNFFALYRDLTDSWRWYDNTAPGSPHLIASGEDGIETVSDPPTWRHILDQVGESDAGREHTPRPPDAVDLAVREAMRKAVLRHARTDSPVCTWRDGEVVWLSPREAFDLVDDAAG